MTRLVAAVGRERVIGLLVVGLGLGLALVVQARWPVGVPLYDGVVVTEPYRYLHPTGQQAGNPTSFETTKEVAGGRSPAFAAPTTESPAQAQLVAQEGAFSLPAGTTALQISVKPVDGTVQPTEGVIAGNVYRFSVTDQAGNPVGVSPCDECRTIVLRTPDEAAEATVAHLENGTWVSLQTLHAGIAAMLQVKGAAPGLGDYAVIAAQAPDAGGGADALIFGAIALALFFAAVAGLFWYRRRPPPVPVAQLGVTRRVPSKRKAPRKPPSGRSGS